MTKNIEDMDEEELELYIATVGKGAQYPLRRTEEIRLANKIEQGDTNALHTLQESYTSLALECAQEYYRHDGWRGITLGAFIHEANIGLSLAAARYGVNKNQTFTNFARAYIQIYLDKLVESHRDNPHE